MLLKLKILVWRLLYSLERELCAFSNISNSCEMHHSVKCILWEYFVNLRELLVKKNQKKKACYSFFQEIIISRILESRIQFVNLRDQRIWTEAFQVQETAAGVSLLHRGCHVIDCPAKTHTHKERWKHWGIDLSKSQTKILL